MNKWQILRAEIQSRCFHWARTHQHAACVTANGSGRKCSFCELVDRMDELDKGYEQPGARGIYREIR